MVALNVAVEPSRYVPDLVMALRKGGCRAERTGRAACRVVHLSAVDEAEARVEVAFFVRAWATRHPAARVFVR